MMGFDEETETNW
jgi:hypothetical protein